MAHYNTDILQLVADGVENFSEWHALWELNNDLQLNHKVFFHRKDIELVLEDENFAELRRAEYFTRYVYIQMDINFRFYSEGDDDYFLFHEFAEAKERAQLEGADVCLVLEDESIPLECILRAEIFIENLETGERTVIPLYEPYAWFTAMQAWFDADQAVSWARLRVVWQKGTFLSSFVASEISIFRV